MKPLNQRLWLLSQQIIKPKGEGKPGFFIDEKTKAFLAAICEAAENSERRRLSTANPELENPPFVKYSKEPTRTIPGLLFLTCRNCKAK